jgi:chromosome segregation protein
MLQALELVGFKSFADRTRFEFGPGITVVVGPNGSGKSNVVDAIKWVLGEQSVRSLRGQEMIDVIFNGSATRHALNAAEATITLDNSRRFLAFDADQLQLTRRVYRSGEGEYLINRQPVRRRDIRDLLAGTGLGADTYCIIEQGKVDALLQSSPVDRRLIIEEAAGISRFRIKKVETHRRLERVEQNLVRLKDIVDEVESRLRSVRIQAGKARRHQEYATRLQLLRTQSGRADWARQGRQLTQAEAELAALRGDLAELENGRQALEAQHRQIDARWQDAGDQMHAAEARLAVVLRELAAHDSTIEHEQQRLHELEAQVVEHRRQWGVLARRAAEAARHEVEAGHAVGVAKAELNAAEHRAADAQAALEQVAARLDALRDQAQRQRDDHLQRTRQLAAVEAEIASLEFQSAQARQAQQAGQTRQSQIEATLQAQVPELQDLVRRQAELESEDEHLRAALEAARRSLADLQSAAATIRLELATRKQRHAATCERRSVLWELQRRQENLGVGAKKILALAKDEALRPLHNVLGVVAELFQVHVRAAPVLEAALGEVASWLVMRADPQTLDWLIENSPRLPGRASLLPLREPEELPPDLDGQGGVIGRADRFVEASPAWRALATQLLGSTWVVEDLETARRLHVQQAAASPGPRATFVTLAGEVLRPDGSLSIGPPETGTGLLSRRSELRVLADEIDALEKRIAAAEAELSAAEAQIAEGQARLDSLIARSEECRQALSHLREQIALCEQRMSQLQRDRQVQIDEVEAAARLEQAAVEQLPPCRQRHEQQAAELWELEQHIAAAGRQTAALEAQRQQAADDVSLALVEQARSQERLASLHAQWQQFQDSAWERQRQIADCETQLADDLNKAASAAREILRAESDAARLWIEKESLATRTGVLADLRQALRQERAAIAEELEAVRAEIHRREEAIHALDRTAAELRLQRASLADRLRDDYGIDLAQLPECELAEPAELPPRDVVEQEIAELRRKLNNLGHVNLDALAEIDELEARFGSLSAQYQDLAQAKRGLEEIIERINADSRRLFTQTFDSVREHFQTLFRKLFGGGQADILLDPEVDVLDSGIDIVAQPPGKELRSISLLSGGEKTLTCVALLLALFRSRPSPFCILDEVDAALDEANIGRFVSVLQEFLQWTQFVVVTHSKKTMTCAHTLYGVTMQESGVSKRVSVRFEDVTDDGQILAPQQDGTQAA